MGTKSRELFNDLDQFIGSTIWIRHPLAQDTLFTEGVLYLAARAGAMWLLDEIIFAQKSNPDLQLEEFQVWTLIVDGSAAILRCDDGNGTVLLEKLIDYTDFPEPGIKLYFTNGVIMLPGEY